MSQDNAIREVAPVLKEVRNEIDDILNQFSNTSAPFLEIDAVDKLFGISEKIRKLGCHSVRECRKNANAI